MVDYLNKYLVDPSSPSGIINLNGITVGTVRKDGYWRVGKEKYYVHRIIWNILNGEIPEGYCIDHIDGNPSNNKIENLRLVSHTENMRNSKMKSHNKTGVNGVSIFTYKHYVYYTAQWREDGKIITKRFSINKLGEEEAFRLAVEVRKQAEKDLGMSERHGLPE